MKEVIKEILVQNQERNLSKGLRVRHTGLSLDLEKIQTIIGPRHISKTSAIT